jgi:hypothetical protein
VFDTRGRSLVRVEYRAETSGEFVELVFFSFDTVCYLTAFYKTKAGHSSEISLRILTLIVDRTKGHSP